MDGWLWLGRPGLFVYRGAGVGRDGGEYSGDFAVAVRH
jgi:hypothetical protein